MQQRDSINQPGGSGVTAGLADDWLTPGRFGIVLGLLILASFPEVVLGLKTFVVRDFGFFAYPLAHFQRECFWRGQLPFWDPYNNCGVPFLAQWNTMPLYPPALIYLLLPLAWSLGLFCLLHLFFAGFGMYFLARRWAGSGFAGGVAGVIFAFNGLSLNMLMWPSHIATLSWVPWVLLTVEEAWRQGGRKIAPAAFTGGLQMLAGGPETILMTWVLAAALWLMEIVQSRVASRKTFDPAGWGSARYFWRFPLVVLFVAGLAAVQLMPFLDLASHSQRDQDYADSRWSMPGSGWANFLVPMVFGKIWHMGVFFQHNQAWTSSYYVGIGTLLLAAFGIWHGRSWRVWLLTGIGTVALLLSFGDQVFLYRWVRHVLPQLAFVTYPIKFVTLVVFISPVLAAFGFARWQTFASEKRPEIRLLGLGIILLSLIGGVLVWAWRDPVPADNVSATIRNGLSRAGFLLWTMLILTVVKRVFTFDAARISQGFNLKSLVPLILLGVFWLDVWTHAPNQNPIVTPEIYTTGLVRAKLAMQPQPELGQSRVMVTPSAERGFTGITITNPHDNFLVKRLGYFANCNLLDEVPKVNGFFSLYPHESGELVSAIYGSTNLDLARLADFMSVSQMTRSDKFFEWDGRTSFLPMVTAGQTPVYLEDLQAARSLFGPGFDGAKQVVLPMQDQSRITVRTGSSARVLRSRFEIQKVEAEVEATDPSMIVIGQTYYHCWQAYVDGKPTPLLRANYAFQALEVGSGRHQVLLVYRDRAFLIGSIISGCTLLLLVVTLIRFRPGPSASNQASHA